MPITSEDLENNQRDKSDSDLDDDEEASDFGISEEEEEENDKIDPILLAKVKSALGNKAIPDGEEFSDDDMVFSFYFEFIWKYFRRWMMARLTIWIKHWRKLFK